MEIQHNKNDKNGNFKAISNNETAGLMTYTWAGSEKMIIDHTEVDSNFKGQGVGKKMVLEAVSFARQNNLKTLPLCPFAKATFNKDSSLSDVLF